MQEETVQKYYFKEDVYEKEVKIKMNNSIIDIMNYCTNKCNMQEYEMEAIQIGINKNDYDFINAYRNRKMCFSNCSKKYLSSFDIGQFLLKENFKIYLQNLNENLKKE